MVEEGSFPSFPFILPFPATSSHAGMAEEGLVVTHQFNGIHLVRRGGKAPGKLELIADRILWTSRTPGISAVEVATNTVTASQWSRAPRGFLLRLLREDGTVVKFLGFRDVDRKAIGEFLGHSDVALRDQRMCTKGTNYGDLDVEGSSVVFKVDGEQTFELPLDTISNAQLAGKNELALEFYQEDVGFSKQDESLVEIRFHIPDEAKGENAGEKRPTAAGLQDTILKKANIQPDAGEEVVRFDDMHCIVPRGRYGLELFDKYFKMHGKTHDYKILYLSVQGCYYLPKPDQIHVAFVVHISPPVRQGATTYPFLVFQLSMNEDLEVQLRMSEEALRKHPKLSADMRDTFPELFGTIFSSLANTKILKANPVGTSPEPFRSSAGAEAVRCSLKANDGWLYPLREHFFFINKPPTCLAHRDVHAVEFARVAQSMSGATNRNFDLIFHVKDGSTLHFSQIDRNEYNALFDFIRRHRISVRNIQRTQENDRLLEAKNAARVDAYLAKVDAGEPVGDDVLAEGEEEEEDEDFVASEESDVPEEFDEHYQAEGSGDEEAEAAGGGGGEKRKLVDSGDIVKKPKQEDEDEGDEEDREE